MNVEEKAAYLMLALVDLYKDPECRECRDLPELEYAEDKAEDLTAMLLALQIIYQNMTRDYSSDLIDFTHILNKLAVQRIMSRRDDDGP